MSDTGRRLAVVPPETTAWSAGAPAPVRGGVPDAWVDGFAAGFLGTLPPRTQSLLLRTAHAFEASPRQLLYAESGEQDAPHLVLVLRGLVRVYRTSLSGRELTLRHARSGDVLGLPSVLTGSSPAAAQAIAPTSGLYLSVPAFRAVAQEDARVAWAAAEATANSLFAIQERLAHNVFAPIRARVARHLLDVASPIDGSLVAMTSNEEIADGIGTVREVVARALARLREEGSIKRARNGIVIVDAARLRVEAMSDDFRNPDLRA